MDILIEEWRDVEGFPGYRISNHGRVESSRRGATRILVPVPIGGRHRHLTVKMSRGSRGTEVKKQIHRLVMQAFVGDSDLQVNHINGDPTNNRLTNLEYVTCQENIDHAYRTGLRSVEKAARGSRHGRSKLMDSDVAEILNRLSTETASGIARSFGVSKGTVLRIKHGVGWTHIIRNDA